MKRDLELIRNILLKCENDTSMQLYCEDFMEENKYSFNEVSYHISLLLDNGFIEAAEIPIAGTLYSAYWVQRLTMYGHDYLDSVRDESIWRQTKERLGKCASSVALPTIAEVASNIIKASIGI